MANDLDLDKLYTQALYQNTTPTFDTERLDKLYTLALYHDTALMPAPAGRAKVWNGSAWVIKPVKVWSGSAWVGKPVKTWTGSAWV